MLTTKNWPAVAVLWAILFLTTVLGPGCKPPGPAQLIKGENLLKEGRHAEAIETLQSAIPSLKSNALAQAWNHLGLAYHASGKPNEAGRAYQQAVTVDRNLAAARFNFGCLLLEQDNLPGAINELTTFTVLNSQSVDGWLKLGHAQLRAKRPEEAERSFRQAERLKGLTPEILNGMGVSYFQRRQPQDAVRRFSEALQLQPKYPPALLNLAIAQQQSFANKQSALALYREFLGTVPPSDPNVSQVQRTVAQLELELQPRVAVATNPPPVVAQQPIPAPAATNRVAPPDAARTNMVAAVDQRPPTAVRSEPELPTRSLRSTNAAPVDTKSTIVQKSPPQTNAPVAQVEPERPLEVVTLPPEIVVAATRDVPARAPATNSPATNRVAETETPSAPPLITKPLSRPAEEDKKSWTDRVNPLNWFKRDREGGEPEEKRPPGKDIQIAASQSPAERLLYLPEPTAPPRAPKPRYQYLKPGRGQPGDRATAEARMATGVEAHRGRRWNEAMAAYQQSVQADPSYLEAHLNLAMAAHFAGRLDIALQSAERALAVDPASSAARYQLAYSLQAADFAIDAALELERLVEAEPNNVRAHLLLANIYAQDMNDIPGARKEYQRVLQLDPQHPRAREIRYWLAGNP